MKFRLKKPYPNNIKEQNEYNSFKLELSNYSSNINYDDKQNPLYDIVEIDLSEVENEDEFNNFLNQFSVVIL